MEHKPQKLVMANQRHLWRSIPRGVAYGYIPKRLHGEMRELEKAGKAVDPLWYNRDPALLHKLRVWRIQHRQYKWYAESMERPKD